MGTELVIRAQGGDQEAFARLAESHIDRLLDAARHILGDAHLAEDATQQALLDIWRNLPTLRDPERFEAWTYRLLVNACHTQSRSRRRWLPNLIPDSPPEPAGPDDLRVLLDRDQLERAFARLSLDHRAVVVLHHYLDLPLEQVATALDVPAGTVRSRLFHAMRQLRASLEADARSGATEQPVQEVTR